MIKQNTILQPLVAGVLLLLASQEIRAQCVTYSIIVTGEVHSAAAKKEVVVRIRANHGKRISEAKATPDDNNRFRAEMPFDTFVSVHLFGGHNCSRRPTGVEVVLIGDGMAKQVVKLFLEHDFTWDPKLAEWRINRPVALGELPATSSNAQYERVPHMSLCVTCGVFDFCFFTGSRVKYFARNPMDRRKNSLDFHYGPGV